ncbi:MAG: nuclear transport factor 2 family protein [Gillisia sp.]
MKNYLLLVSLLTLFFSCDNHNKSAEKIKTTRPYHATSPEASKDSINKNLDAWHQAAANADFDSYFGYMAEDAVYIGTDPSENWQNKDFRNFAKPYFDKGKAWDFKVLDRNVYVSDVDKFAWFDELLDTQMGVCRGSGVMKKIDGKWKIKHYVLSVTVPNDQLSEVTQLKKNKDSLIIASH